MLDMRSALVPLTQLREIQGCAGSGGMVRSEWRNQSRLRAGQLVRRDGWWQVITGMSLDKLGGGHRVQLLSADGERTSVRLLRCDGLEVRTDTRIDRATLQLAERGTDTRGVFHRSRSRERARAVRIERRQKPWRNGHRERDPGPWLWDMSA